MYQRILVAIDDSETAGRALAAAIDLARQAGAALCVAHAVDESLLVQHGMGIGTYIDIPKAAEAIREAGNQMLEEAVAKAKAAGVAAERRLLESTDQRVAQMLAGAAADWRADLLVAGTHGRRGVERLLVGSVAENLVRLAPCALLLERG